MILFVNENNEIKDVNTTDYEGLTPLVVDDVDNPFANWSVAKICCYKVNVIDGKVTMLTPYVDSRLIEHIERLGKGEEVNTQDITDTQLALAETYEEVGDNTSDIDICMNAIAEIWEAIGE